MWPLLWLIAWTGMRAGFFLVQHAARGPRAFFCFCFSCRFFWVFPPVSPPSDCTCVRPAVGQTLSCSHVASLPYHTAMCVVSPPPEQVPGAACPPSVTGGLLFQKCRTTYSRGMNHEQASGITMNRLVHDVSHEPRTSFRSSFWAPETEVWRL